MRKRAVRRFIQRCTTWEGRWSMEQSPLHPTGESSSWSLRFIREQIRSHRISFPSQIPVFPRLHRADIQWRIVVLYFVRGWSSARIGERYGITRERVRQILRQWVSRALLHGYMDKIPAEKDFRGL